MTPANDRSKKGGKSKSIPRMNWKVIWRPVTGLGGALGRPILCSIWTFRPSNGPTKKGT